MIRKLLVVLLTTLTLTPILYAEGQHPKGELVQVSGHIVSYEKSKMVLNSKKGQFEVEIDSSTNIKSGQANGDEKLHPGDFVLVSGIRPSPSKLTAHDIYIYSADETHRHSLRAN